MKERPKRFDDEMIRAILDNRKSQFREIVKLTDSWDVGPNYAGECWPVRKRKNFLERMVCPFGTVGDRLWVREAFGYCKGVGLTSNAKDATYVCFRDGSQLLRKDKSYHQWNHAVKESAWPSDWKWRPSIHMPRWASRITLEITSIRVERLNEISNDDCGAEGITAIGRGVKMSDGTYAQAGRYESKASTVRQLFSELWESINGVGSGSANPWVWVIAFTRMES